MRKTVSVGRLGALIGFATLLVAGCSSNDSRPRTAARLSPPVTAGGPSGSEALWHLRAGLNVAALSCRGRGRAPVAGAYGSMLNRHKAALAASYQIEMRRHGQSGLDRHQTQLYNRFALQRKPEQFCGAARDVAKQALSMNSPQLTSAAPKLVSTLDRARN